MNTAILPIYSFITKSQIFQIFFKHVLYNQMKNIYALLLPLLFHLLALAHAEDPLPNKIDINEEYVYELKGDEGLLAAYDLQIPQKAIPDGMEGDTKWYFFVMAEPMIDSDAEIGTPSSIELKKVSKSGTVENIKTCELKEDLDLCYLKDSDLNYTTDTIRIVVTCLEACKYSLFTEVDKAYPLDLDVQFDLDFEDTAYTKIFRINTTQKKEYDELRITLKPGNFLKYSEPIYLLGNWGKEIPSHDQHDLNSLHIWDDGQGIFLHKSEIKNDIITLVITGPEENVLSLLAQTLNSSEPPLLMEYDPYFDEVKEDEKRSYMITFNDSKIYTLKSITFSGALNKFKFEKQDKQTKKWSELEVVENPVQKYGEVEYHFSKELISKHSLQTVKVTVEGKKQSTYIIGYNSIDGGIVEIHEYLSESSQMEEGQIDQYYLKVYELLEHEKKEQVSKIEVILGNVKGKVVPRFFQCKKKINFSLGDTLEKCEVPTASINKLDKNSFIELTPKEKDEKNGMQRYWFEIDWKDISDSSDRDKSAMVMQMIIVVENANSEDDKESSYEVQFKNKDRIYLLKEAEQVKDRVSIQEKRHYKFQVSAVEVEEVRIHVTQISGAIKAVGSFEDPRLNKNFSQIYPTHNIIYFPLENNQERKVKEIFLQVEGIDNAFYSLTSQVIRNSESDPMDPDSKGYNELIVREETPYEYILRPNERVVFQLHVTEKEFTMFAKASSSVSVCMTQDLDSPPFDPNCEIKMKNFTHLEELVKMDKGLVGNIGFTNLQNKNVTLNILISKQNALCNPASLNTMMVKEIRDNGKDEQGISYHCLEFMLHKRGPLEVMVRLDSQLYANHSIELKINDVEKVRMTGPIYHFSEDEIISACDSAMEHTSFCYLKVVVQNVSNTKVHIFVQYEDSIIRLIDGFSHSVHGKMVKPNPRKFFYPVFNLKEVKLVLDNIEGEYKMYINILNYVDFLKNIMNNVDPKTTFPTADKNLQESSNPFFFLQQVMTIKTDLIKEKCEVEGKVDCVVEISVGLAGDTEVMTNGKFSIMATQEVKELKEGNIEVGYLTKKSSQFFTFHNIAENGTIVIEVSNQNQNCLNMYFRQGSQLATSSEYDKMAKNSNTLMMEKAKKETYSLTLVATQNCPFTLQIFTSKDSYQRIKKGTFLDIKLEEGSEKNFIFENLINETFKILAMHDKGEVVISVKPVAYDKLETEMQKKTPNGDYVWSNKDAVRVDSMDYEKNKPHPNYCINCFYLINIKAIRNTTAVLTIPTPGSEVSLSKDSIVKDLLLKDEISIFRIFTESQGKFEIHVQHGGLNVEIYDTDKKAKIFNKSYSTQKEAVIQQFKFPVDQTDYEFFRYAKIKITATEESYYTFGFISNDDPQQRGNSLKFGIPEYIFLEKAKQKCVKGMVDKKSDYFLISFSKAEKDIAKNMKITFKVNGNEVKIEKESSINEFIVTTSNRTMMNGSFSLCLTSPNDSISATVIQSSPVIFWPEHETMLVKNELNMTFVSEGTNIIEVNECSERAITSIFSEFNDLKSISSKIKQRRKSNNLVEFYHYGSVFINAQSKKATYKWLQYDDSEGRGIGYEEYESGWMRVLPNSDGTLEVTVQTLQQNRDRKLVSSIEEIQYNFYAAKEQMDLYSAMNCNDGSFLFKTVSVGGKEASLQSTNEKSTASVKFSIVNELKPTFSQFSYFLIGMKATLKIKNKIGEMEHYRFFYPYQQVSRAMLDQQGQSDWEEEGEDYDGFDEIMMVIGYVVLAVVVGLGGFCVYKRYLKRCMGRRRMQDSMGIEINYNQFTSSDR